MAGCRSAVATVPGRELYENHGETRQECVAILAAVGVRLTEQSEPAVSGHGRQAPELQLPGVVQPPRSSPILHPQL